MLGADEAFLNKFSRQNAALGAEAGHMPSATTLSPDMTRCCYVSS